MNLLFPTLIYKLISKSQKKNFENIVKFFFEDILRVLEFYHSFLPSSSWRIGGF